MQQLFRKDSLKLMIFGALVLTSSACVTTTGYVEKKQALQTAKITTIAVLAFSNDDLLRRPASAWLSHRLTSQPEISIINEAQAELELKQQGYRLMTVPSAASDQAGKPGRLFPQLEEIHLKKPAVTEKIKVYSVANLQKVGKLLNVDAVLTGYTQLEETRLIVVGLRLVEVESGKILLETQHVSGAPFSDYHKGAQQALDVASAALLNTLLPGAQYDFTAIEEK